ncbi:MAG: class I SAM-dependent methyltransferase [Gammaproteobacteria bacterium]|nr:class I SAM-dependent methyltransferase [Gammaproteobacteria bacterium]
MALLNTKKNANETLLAQHIHNRTINTAFKVRLPNGRILSFGDGEPEFILTVHDDNALSAILAFDELRFTEAYINGGLDIEGQIWAVINCRESLRDLHPLHHFWQRIRPFFTGQLRTNKHAIHDHYEFDTEFFLSFLDSSRCYSQALFEHDDETLETAQLRKLQTIVNSCKLKAGDRVLDVGGGWGTFVEYAGKQGIKVTALTLAQNSQRYINDLIQRLALPCQVKQVDFYQYVSPEPYDAIVILGVMEHLPNYRAVLQQLQRLLRPGGKIYLDASSFREKYSKPTFISRYVFPGNHRYFCLHDFLSQLSKTNFELIRLDNDRHSYYLTCRQWARNLEAARDDIINRWGQQHYRIFNLYLWGSAHSFFNRSMDAYRLVLEFPAPACQKTLQQQSLPQINNMDSKLQP